MKLSTILFLAIATLSVQPTATFAQKQKKALKKPAELKQHLRSDTVGIVNGEVITFGDFNGVMSNYLKILTKRSGNDLLTDSLYSQIVDSAWVKMEQDIIIEQEIVKRKLEVPEHDALDSLIANPPLALKQQFIDSAGAFHRNYFEQAFRDPRNDSIIRQLVLPYQSMMEMARLRAAIASESRAGASESKAGVDPFDVWLKRSIAKAKIVDHRLNFGFY